MLRKLFRFLFERTPEQTTFVYCPNCRFELTAGGTMLSDDAKGVAYCCKSCEHLSLWDFDAPVPLLISGSVATGGPV